MGIGTRGEHGAGDFVRLSLIGEERHELIADLLYRLRADLEQRRDYLVAVRSRADAHGKPVLVRVVRGDVASARGAHAPNASFILAQKPLPRESRGTLFCTSWSRSMSKRSSSLRRSGGHRCTRT